jgi:uncharacterized RDD family membrane protein YckC
MDPNPYQPPVAELRDLTLPGEAQPLAGRLMRLVAVIIDGLFYSVASLVVGLGAGFSDDAIDTLWGVSLALYLVSMALVLGVNIYLLHRSGQTIGKLAVNIKIVRSDGSRAGLARLFFLRTLLIWILYWIPLFNLLFILIDVMFIFRHDRRCVHDFIADTKVVNA